MRKQSNVGLLFSSFYITSFVSVFSSTIGVFLDTVLVGRILGEKALAVMSLIIPITLLINMLSLMVSDGGIAVGGRYRGKGDLLGMNQIFTLCIAFVSVAGLTLSVLLVVFPTIISNGLGAQDQELLSLTVDYLRGVALLLPFSLARNCFSTFVRMDGSIRLSLCGNFTMIVGKLVFGLLALGPLQLGLFGVGLGGGISSILAICVMATHFHKKERAISFTRLTRKTLRQLGATLSAGLPDALGFLFSAVASVIVNRLLLRYAGVSGVSAYAVMSNTDALISPLLMSSGYALVPVTGMLLGERDLTAMRNAFGIAMRRGTIAALLGMAFVLLAAPGLAGFFGATNPETLAYALTALRIYALTLVIRQANNLFVFLYQSEGALYLALLIPLVRCLALYIPLTLLLAPSIGVRGIWLGEALTQGITLGCILLWPFLVRRARGDYTYRLLRQPTLYGVVLEQARLTQRDLPTFSQTVESFLCKHNVSEQAVRYIRMALQGITIKQPADVHLRVEDGCIDLKLRAQRDTITTMEEANVTSTAGISVLRWHMNTDECL